MPMRCELAVPRARWLRGKQLTIKQPSRAAALDQFTALAALGIAGATTLICFAAAHSALTLVPALAGQ
jgi:hypothetical protein